MRSTTGAKLFMLAVHVTAVIAGIYGGLWIFDQVS